VSHSLEQLLSVDENRGKSAASHHGLSTHARARRRPAKQTRTPTKATKSASRIFPRIPCERAEISSPCHELCLCCRCAGLRWRQEPAACSPVLPSSQPSRTPCSLAPRTKTSHRNPSLPAHVPHSCLPCALVCCCFALAELQACCACPAPSLLPRDACPAACPRLAVQAPLSAQHCCEQGCSADCAAGLARRISVQSFPKILRKNSRKGQEKEQHTRRHNRTQNSHENDTN